MKNRFFYLQILLLAVISCTSDKLVVDVSQIDFSIEHKDVVKAFNDASNIQDLTEVNKQLNEQATELYEFYTAEMLRVGLPLEDSTPVFLQKFLTDSTMMLVNSKLVNKFGDFDTQMREVTNMFKHLKYHIPQAMLPSKLLTYNSTFPNGIISTPNYIGVGLEMYLGPEDDIVKQVPFPEYFKAKMNPDFMLCDMAQSWLESNVLEGAKEESFIANLIYYGKLLYTVKAMLPELENSNILRYSEDNWTWAKENEYAVWQYIVHQNLVYDTKMKTMLRYFKPAPSTIGFDGSPDRLGQYLGLRIVSSYMQKNPNVSIKELIAEKNQSKILKAYKPKE